jgi:hypothetical protein
MIITLKGLLKGQQEKKKAACQVCNFESGSVVACGAQR